MAYKCWFFSSAGTGAAGVGTCTVVNTGALTANVQKTVSHGLNRSNVLLISRDAANNNNAGVGTLKVASAPDDPLNEFYIKVGGDIAAPGLPIQVIAWN